MHRSDYLYCKNCGRSREDVGPLSHTRLCSDCAEVRFVANAIGIRDDTGPEAQRRKYGYARQLFGPRVALALKQAGLFDAGEPIET